MSMHDLDYQQAWYEHRQLARRVEWMEQGVVDAIALRENARQQVSMDGPDAKIAAERLPQYEGNVRDLEAGRAVAQAELQAFSERLAQSNPQHAELLQQGVPPQIDVDRQVQRVEHAASILMDVGAKAVGLELELGDSPTGHVVVQSVGRVAETVLVRENNLRMLADSMPASPETELHNRVVAEVETSDLARNRDAELARLDRKHELQAEMLEQRLDKAAEVREQRIERGEVKDVEALREASERAAAQEREALQERQAREREAAERALKEARDAAEKARLDALVLEQARDR